ncbi:MAG: hypothetical protein ABR528_14065 [Pseudonocardiaceae bacterium]
MRLAVRGVLDARRLQVAGEARLSGARVDGNVDLRARSYPDLAATRWRPLECRSAATCVATVD